MDMVDNLKKPRPVCHACSERSTTQVKYVEQFIIIRDYNDGSLWLVAHCHGATAQMPLPEGVSEEAHVEQMVLFKVTP